MALINGKTAAPPYVFNLEDRDPTTGKDPAYRILPLLTVGDEIPLLEGDFGEFTASDDLTFAMNGIPDGLGLTQIDGLYYVWMNHEISHEATTEISSTLAGQINGARVSLFVFDGNWNAIAGKNLIQTAEADGGKYKLNLSTGNYELIIDPVTQETDSDQILNGDSHGNFTRFCSAYLAASGFVDDNGQEIPIYFTAEETTGTPESPGESRGWAITPDDGNALALDGLGIYAKEQVYSPVQYRATNSDYTVILSTEDYKNGELYMYVGKQTTANPNGFTNNPEEFDLYVLQVVDPETGDVFAYETMPENIELTTRWQQVPDEIALGTQDELSEWVDGEDEGVQRSTNFRRLEDLHQDPNDPSSFYFAVTGTNDIPEGSSEADNPYGKIYRLGIEVDPTTGIPSENNIEFLLEGGARTGVSYDNITVDSNGNLLIQEDPTGRGQDVIDNQERNARVISYNINHNENRVGNDEVTFLFELDQTAAGDEFDNDGFGAWETSGIIEVDPQALPNRSSYLFDVQAHTVENESNENTEVLGGRYEQGGQLILVEPVPQTELKGFASLDADTFAEGPSSGNFITGETPRPVPFRSQPVQGFSGIQFSPLGDGSYWVLSDNGFGSKENSGDYLLRIHQINPNFAGTERGDASVEVESFIQLRDPDRLLPFEIVNEETTDRFLTGADLDPESFVIDAKGDIWVGDEFGPYVLHFDSTGKLIEAPIPTPNYNQLNTLNQQTPLVIGHRGASGELPEHTLEAYTRAIEQGADFIEPDLVITRDGVLIARHEPNLINTTDVRDRPEFADRLTTKMVDGVEEEGFFAEDFTLEEIKTLRAIQPRSDRDQSFNGQFEIPTFAEIIDKVKQVEAETGVKVGIYPETKHPTYFDQQGLSLEEPLVQTLLDKEFTDPRRIFIQSFEVQNLIELKEAIQGTPLENTPLVQLYDEFHIQPYDIVANFSDPNFDPQTVYGTTAINRNTNYGDLINQDGSERSNLLKDFVANYASGIGPWKRTFVLTEPLETPVDGNNDGTAAIAEQLTGEVLPVIEDAHEAGLQVHPYTFRNEERHLVLDEQGRPQTAQQEIEQFIRLGVDGFFTDFPETGDIVRDRITDEYVRSPQNPDVLAGNAESNIRTSRGFEGMGFSPDRMTLYPLLEGSVTGDPANALRIHKIDVATSTYQGLVGYYKLENQSHAIGDMTPINDHEFLVIERDNNQGEDAEFKKIFKIDINNIDNDGFVAKEEIVDLLNIFDPQDLNGDENTTYDMPFVTIEDVLVLDAKTILVANDNNYPFSIGRGPDIDNNEFAIIELDKPLNLDPRLGGASLGNQQFELVFGTDEADNYDAAMPRLGFDGVRDKVFANGGDDVVNASTSSRSMRNVISGGIGNDTLTASKQDHLYGGMGEDMLDASSGMGNNHLHGEYGNDKLIAGMNDVLEAGEGEDTIDATTDMGNNSLYGGTENDVLLLGSGDYVFGDNGDDQFYVGTGGDNIISGGEGADQFWIANEQLVGAVNPEAGLVTSANIITDFRDGTDAIGIVASLGIEQSDISLTQQGTAVLININEQNIARVVGVDVSDLTITMSGNAFLIM